MSTGRVLNEVLDERARQEARWGEQNHPDANPNYNYPIGNANHCKMVTEDRADRGKCTFADILIEEVAEAVDEALAGDKAKLRTELVQVAAVAVKWIEKLDRGM